jgi:hypothetical protein
MTNIYGSHVDVWQEQRNLSRESSISASDIDLLLPTRRKNLSAHFGVDESVSKADLSTININALPRDRNTTDLFVR